MSEGLARDRCPLCGQPNQCAEASGEAGDCWCRSAALPQGGQLAMPGVAARPCLCPDCLSRAQAGIEARHE